MCITKKAMQKKKKKREREKTSLTYGLTAAKCVVVLFACVGRQAGLLREKQRELTTTLVCSPFSSFIFYY